MIKDILLKYHPHIFCVALIPQTWDETSNLNVIAEIPNPVDFFFNFNSSDLWKHKRGNLVSRLI